MNFLSSRKRQIRRLFVSLFGLSVIVGGVASANTVSDFIPSILASQNDASLAMVTDPSVLGVLGALGFYILATLRRNQH